MRRLFDKGNRGLAHHITRPTKLTCLAGAQDDRDRCNCDTAGERYSNLGFCGLIHGDSCAALGKQTIEEDEF